METPGSQPANQRVLKGVNLNSLLLLLTFQRSCCRVVGDSMVPTLSSGDLIIYRRINPQTYLPIKGSIVVLKNPLDPKSLIIKRIYDYNSNSIEIRGDNEEKSIDSRQYGSVQCKSIFGVVERIIPLQANRS